jgi:hypothetical protein
MSARAQWGNAAFYRVFRDVYHVRVLIDRESTWLFWDIFFAFFATAKLLCVISPDVQSLLKMTIIDLRPVRYGMLHVHGSACISKQLEGHAYVHPIAFVTLPLTPHVL